MVAIPAETRLDVNINSRLFAARQCHPFRFVSENPAEPYVADDLQLVVASRDASEKRYWWRLRGEVRLHHQNVR